MRHVSRARNEHPRPFGHLTDRERASFERADCLRDFSAEEVHCRVDICLLSAPIPLLRRARLL